MSFSVLVYEEMRLPLELLSATLILLLPYAPRKPHFLPRVISCFVGMTLFSLIYFVIFGTDKGHPRYRLLILFWYLLIFLFAPLFASICFELTTSDALIIGTLAFPLQNIVYCFFHVWICQLVFPYIREHLYIYIPATVIVCSGLFYLAYRLFTPILKESDPPLQEDTKKSKISNSILYVIFVFFLIYYQAILNRGPAFINHVSWISGVLACVLILGFQYNFINALVYAGKTKNMEQMLKNNEHYYQLSKEHISIINRKCHDLKHQLKVLRTVSDEERNEYIDEAEKSIIFYQDLIHTDNEALNTILAEKGLFCRENNISFHCSVDDANLSFIRVSDLYALMGNAIDNAIEYTIKQTDENLRSISLRIDQKKNFIGIQITNPLSEEDAKIYRTQSKSILPSSKSDKNYHGFGMKSIRYLCEKYNGSMEFSTSHGLFTMQIVLPTNQIPS